MTCVSVSRAWHEFKGKEFVLLTVAKYNNQTVYIFET